MQGEPCTQDGLEPRGRGTWGYRDRPADRHGRPPSGLTPCHVSESASDMLSSRPWLNSIDLRGSTSIWYLQLDVRIWRQSYNANLRFPFLIPRDRGEIGGPSSFRLRAAPVSAFAPGGFAVAGLGPPSRRLRAARRKSGSCGSTRRQGGTRAARTRKLEGPPDLPPISRIE